MQNPTNVCTIWYMVVEDSVEIDAPAQLVWEVFSDVESWPEWTASVTSLVARDGAGLAIGKRFAIKQPGMSKLVWKVSEIDPGSSWAWVQRSPGVRVSARHWVIPQPGGRTLVRQQLDQRGVLGALVGRLMVKKTKRFLELEAQGLKARSEQLSRANGRHS
jgi:uncharacterized membrane protein